MKCTREGKKSKEIHPLLFLLIEHVSRSHTNNNLHSHSSTSYSSLFCYSCTPHEEKKTFLLLIFPCGTSVQHLSDVDVLSRICRQSCAYLFECEKTKKKRQRAFCIMTSTLELLIPKPLVNSEELTTVLESLPSYETLNHTSDEPAVVDEENELSTGLIQQIRHNSQSEELGITTSTAVRLHIFD